MFRLTANGRGQMIKSIRKNSKNTMNEIFVIIILLSGELLFKNNISFFDYIQKQLTNIELLKFVTSRKLQNVTVGLTDKG